MTNRSILRTHTIVYELNALTRDADLCRCDAFIQHGDTSCLLHCIAVAFYSMRILDALHVRYDRHALVRGALLHDFFLYDWHTHKHMRRRGERPHAFTHPAAALNNARECISLSDKEENIILRHMFPATLIPPSCREGLIVCLTDKFCAVYESIHRKAAYPKLRPMYSYAVSANA